MDIGDVEVSIICAPVCISAHIFPVNVNLDIKWAPICTNETDNDIICKPCNYVYFQATWQVGPTATESCPYFMDLVPKFILTDSMSCCTKGCFMRCKSQMEEGDIAWLKTGISSFGQPTSLHLIFQTNFLPFCCHDRLREVKKMI